MALFDVPGWTVQATPVAEQSNRLSKKRKRPSLDTEKVQPTEINLDKLVKKLKGGANRDGAKGSADSSNVPGTSKCMKRERKKERDLEERKQIISLPKPLKRHDRTSTSPQSTKRLETKHERKESSSSYNSILGRKSAEVAGSGLTALQQGMKQSLDGARFRIINENLYKSSSQAAHQLMRSDPKVFDEYHVGFRHQVQSWPTNPVEHYIAQLSNRPPKTLVADLGCGDAALSKALVPKGLMVMGFDLVSDSAYVVEADICHRLPLPGSEGSEDEKSFGEGQIVDVVVCALSLMGTNWPNCLREAWRVLVPNGELKIAEVTSRFTDIEDFQSLVTSIGFKLSSMDKTNTHFTLFEFRKVSRKCKSAKEWAKIGSKGSLLKPCEYKRR
ncbi:hypothetical protein BDN72DRAFT_930669 [Pluteus cervinus]|uniref:Uncharacterized protein n=1 Tax=Pluteus cervinus TaxID=181527 RepID=A0ACD3BDV6_9AGAR|nr:hypothetical protein BDN72DRAFT_930669 [Pluteus cervinus]